MVALDNRVLLVALPTLTQVFKTDLTTIQWTLLIYELALIGLVITLGRMGDLFGRKRFYVAGFLIFIFGSAFCGVSQSPGQLIVFRFVQALGGAMLLANGSAIVSALYPRSERGKALGFTTMAFHVGVLTGPTLGGFLIDTVGWRWIFYINIPVGLWGAYLAWRNMEETAAEEKQVKVDYPGAALILLANSLLFYTMNEIPILGFRHPIVLLFTFLAVTSLSLLVFTELRVEAPVLNLALFRNRLFSFGNLSLFFVTSTQSAIQLLIPFYLQSIMGFSPFQMGWILVTNSVAVVMFAPLAGRLSDRFGSRLLCTTGTALIFIGQFFIASLSFSSSVARIVFPLAISGLGLAIFNTPNLSAILGSVPLEKMGGASGMAITTSRVGAACGLALASTIFIYGLTVAGLTPAQIESPDTWGLFPAIFMRTFNHTIHIINFFTLVAVFFSVARGRMAQAS